MAVAALAAPTSSRPPAPREWARVSWRSSAAPDDRHLTFVLIYRMDYVDGPDDQAVLARPRMSPAEIGTISTNLGMDSGSSAALSAPVHLPLRNFNDSGSSASPGAAESRLRRGRPVQPRPPVSLCGVHAESFGAGLVTAAFLSFLMRICDKRQAATQ